MNLSYLTQLPMRGKLILAGSAVAIVLILFFMLRIAGAPSYTTMMSGLDPAQTGKITAALDEQGIAYELQSGGTALAVEKADTAKARIALAGQGLAGSGGGSAPGFELFDNQKLGASDFQQKVMYQRALEGEIAKTVNGVQGVTNAQVQLVLPEQDLFVDESSPATASVSLGNAGDSLESGAVRGIAQLVSSSVKGLKPAAVTVTDVAGQVLWPVGDSDGGAGGGGKTAAEARYARTLEGTINAMLTRTLGANKAMVQVKADLNMDKTTKNQLVYSKKGVPIKTQTESEKLRGGGATAGGASGTAGNIPTYSAGGGAAGANSNYQRSSDSTDFGVDKTVSKTDVAQGAVNRLNVALVLDKSVVGTGPAAAKIQQDLQNTVATAAGLDTARGDTITATQLAFAKSPVSEPAAGPVPAGLLGALKWAGLVLGTLLFLFFMMRHLKKREGAALPAPEWLSQIDMPVSLASLEAGPAQATRQMGALPDREPDPGLHRLEQLMQREPDRVAAQVRQWMAED